ncbi:MAG: hypothetical protein GXP14_13620 [Gammaproteobacteria bacterium]|nr:hypothetical protein [Gammaproteobacteria bacterium]
MKTRQWGVVMALLSALLYIVAPNVNATSQKNDTRPASLDELHIITNTQLHSTKSSIASLASILQQHKKINFWNLTKKQTLTSVELGHFSEQTRKSKQSPFSSPNKKSLFDLFSFISKQEKQQKTVRHIFIVFDEHSPVPILTNKEYNSISPLIKRFQENNISISTIHLGSTSSAKNFHLHALTIATNGRYQSIANIEKLEKEFLNLISFSLKLNYLPFHDNLVRIDNNTDKISFLLFGTNKNLPIQFIPPQEEKFNQYNYPDNVHWLQEKNFEIIHIDKPEKGTWQIDAQSHPMDKAIISSAFQVEINSIPLQLFPHSAQTLSIKLTQENKHITAPKILDHVVIKVTMLSTQGTEQTWFPMDNGRNGDKQADDGIYGVQLSDALLAGQYHLKIDVDGHLFQRQINTSLNVVTKPFEFFILLSEDASQHTITVVPYAKLIHAETTTITASITSASGKQKEIRLNRKNNFEWQLALDNTPELSPYVVELNIATITYKGKSLSIWLDPMTVGQKPTQIRKTVTHKHHDLIDHDNSITSADTLIENNKGSILSSDEKIESTPLVWITPEIQFVLINFLLLMLILITFHFWSRYDKKWIYKLRGMLSYD